MPSSSHSLFQAVTGDINIVDVLLLDVMLVSGLKQGEHQRKVFLQTDSITSDGMVRNNLDGEDEEHISRFNRGGYDKYVDDTSHDHRTDSYNNEERNINHRSVLNKYGYGDEEGNMNLRRGFNEEDYGIGNRNIKQRNGLIKGYYNHNRETSYRKDMNRDNYHNIHKINSKSQMHVNSYDDEPDLDDNDMWNIENKNVKNTQIGNLTLWDGDKDVNTNYWNGTGLSDLIDSSSMCRAVCRVCETSARFTSERCSSSMCRLVCRA
uniref:Uncharacterized protein n=1 Tax=Timema poppense TaxID=170557 RepID=A0A7R9CV75_TIMPO|nr:unnamed protein product [Timema poppensis]